MIPLAATPSARPMGSTLAVLALLCCSHSGQTTPTSRERVEGAGECEESPACVACGLCTWEPSKQQCRGTDDTCQASGECRMLGRCSWSEADGTCKAGEQTNCSDTTLCAALVKYGVSCFPSDALGRCRYAFPGVSCNQVGTCDDVLPEVGRCHDYETGCEFELTGLDRLRRSNKCNAFISGHNNDSIYR